jgi:hypothetical protein
MLASYGLANCSLADCVHNTLDFIVSKSITVRQESLSGDERMTSTVEGRRHVRRAAIAILDEVATEAVDVLAPKASQDA